MNWAGEKHDIRYIHEDILGSSYYYTNPENGYVTNQHEYTTWGNNTKAPTYNYDPEYRASEPYFTGHPYDGSLNLYYAEARFYDPETGSFLSSDPAESGLNWYQYCNSNPVTYVDPLGLKPLVTVEEDPFFFNKVENSGSGNSILEPGTGTISLRATLLLIDFEDLGEDYKVYENGKLIAVLSRDVEGKGNITYGWGILFHNTPEEKEKLKKEYGLDFGEKQAVPVGLCVKMYKDYVDNNIKALQNFTEEN